MRKVTICAWVLLMALMLMVPLALADDNSLIPAMDPVLTEDAGQIPTPGDAPIIEVESDFEADEIITPLTAKGLAKLELGKSIGRIVKYSDTLPGMKITTVKQKNTVTIKVNNDFDGELYPIDTIVVKGRKHYKVYFFSRVLQSGDVVTVDTMGIENKHTAGSRISYISFHNSGKLCPATYTVSFDLNCENATGQPEAQDIETGTFATRPPDPVREGYEFIDWYTTPDGPEVFSFESTAITSDMTLYACWLANNPVTYTVSFNLNYESATGQPEAQTVTSGSLATRPPDPVREGYEFVDWYTTPDGPETFSFENTPVNSDITLYAGWLEDDPVTNSVTLEAGVNEILTSSDPVTVYFYATPDDSVDNIVLVDAATEAEVATLLDDGLYSFSGDDLPNDGIYSGKPSLSAPEATTLEFYAVAKFGDQEITSNTVTIDVLGDLSETQLTEMEAVDNTLSDWINSADFAAMTKEGRIAATEQLLMSLAEDGTDELSYSLLAKDSIMYDEESSLFTFSYSCGVLGGIMLEQFDPDLDGSDLPVRNPAGAIDTAPLSVNLPLSTLSIAPGSRGDATILYAFDDTVNSWRFPRYVTMETNWENAGLDTTLDSNVTIEDFQTSLKNQDVIIIAMHGNYYTYKYGFLGLQSSTQPAYCTLDATSKAEDKTYSADLKAHRLAKVSSSIGNTYWILPGFFHNHYGSSGLNGAFVYSQPCCSFGEKGIVDYSMASDLTGSGADTVIGYHNSVYSEYSLSLMTSVMDDLLEGSTAKDALDAAKATFGADDAVWANNNGIDPKANPAYPILHGDAYATLISTGLQNGGFEAAYTPLNWDTLGDVRVLSKLGPLVPTAGSKMAILTTGIGSAQSQYLAGEGSMLSQIFIVPDNAKSISLKYDVVSEEPMEWVGSSYDDKFVAELVDTNGTVIATLASESINSSIWSEISDIDFEYGDSTTYHTGWKTISSDSIATYAGQVVTLRFRTWDSGDSAYDTAALVDDVVVN